MDICLQSYVIAKGRIPYHKWNNFQNFADFLRILKNMETRPSRLCKYVILNFGHGYRTWTLDIGQLDMDKLEDALLHLWGVPIALCGYP